MRALDFSFHFVYLWFSVQLHGAAANENVTRYDVHYVPTAF